LANFIKAKAETDALVRAAAVAELHAHLNSLLQTDRNSSDKRLLKFGCSVHSQTDEDGILREIFRRIGVTNRTFVELGASDGLENNTRFLLDQGWSGAWIEGSARKVQTARKLFAEAVAEKRLAVEFSYLTAANVNEVVGRFAPANEIDLLSIDLDGNDYYLLDAIRSVAPRVIVAEYNAKYPADISWVMEYNESHRWDSTDYFGASLKALDGLLSRRGYRLVGCNIVGTNAFFVQSELSTQELFCGPFTPENHYEPARYYLHPAYHGGHPRGFGSFRIGDDLSRISRSTRQSQK
jgi:hypothetical protein